MDFGFEGLLKAAEEEIGPWARKLIVWGALIGVIHHLATPWFGLQSAYKVHQETGGLLVGAGSYLAFQLVVSGLIVAGAWWGKRRLQRMGKATVASLRKQAREGKEVLDSRAA